MTRAKYTYRIYLINPRRVRVEKEEPGKPDNIIPGVFRYQDKITPEVRELIEEVRKNGINDANQSRFLGEALFDTLFDDVLCYDFIRFYNEVVGTKQQLLRVELDIDEQNIPEVAAFPWEFMCLPQRKKLGTMWLATAPGLVFSRLPSQPIPASPIQLGANEKMRIALVVSAPTDLNPVAYEEVQAAIETLAQEQPEQVELLPVVNPASRKAINDILIEKPHIFHFIGHGRFHNENGEIALVDEFDQARWISANDFSELLNRHRPGIIVLQACQGAMESTSKPSVGLASKVVQQIIPVVVAMQYPVSNSTASRFACHFYKQLAQGKSADIAVQEGRREISLHDSTGYGKRDFATPVIFMQVQDAPVVQSRNESVLQLLNQPVVRDKPSHKQLHVKDARQSQGVKRALLIGVSEYGEGLEPLPGATKDLEEIKRILGSPQLGNFVDVKALSNPDRQEMAEAIEELFTSSTKDDLVLLFFSGHGVKDSSNQLYLANRITRKNPQGELVRTTAVSAKAIHDIMKGSRSKRQVVILDCCFSAAFRKGLLVKDDGSVDLQNQLGGEGRAILASSTDYSFSQLDKQLSIYTQYLVEGIETGKADLNRDRVISLDELHKYIKNKIRETLPAMNPKIYTDQEGSKIHIANAPRDDRHLGKPLVTEEGIQASSQADSLIILTLLKKLLSKPVIVITVLASVLIGVAYLAKEYLDCKDIYINDFYKGKNPENVVNNPDFQRRCQLFKHFFW
ncbi:MULTISPECIES: CHAT domain-containing protein [unclassified Moorena]|uniref:caspase, EACC1-associated type n=1 Tax=unclassified Moorena TaxID=2683338 RepID=UPI0013C66F2B|nr:MULTISPECIES: CHAT domain-containing protein [unclassified Moorena]NEO20659.1 CHAT domain-containing protein [Moorena sp. SIO4A5]NEQ59095.1 CHAT domain-containing protein [Moorena sp. SIO4A1]